MGSLSDPTLAQNDNDANLENIHLIRGTDYQEFAWAQADPRSPIGAAAGRSGAGWKIGGPPFSSPPRKHFQQVAQFLPHVGRIRTNTGV